MTPTEVLNEIEKLPLPQAREVVEQATKYVRERETTETTPEEIADDTERREREFERKMFEQGFFASIPTRTMTDEEFDEFELLEIEGEPLSETVLKLRD